MNQFVFFLSFACLFAAGAQAQSPDGMPVHFPPAYLNTAFHADQIPLTTVQKTNGSDVHIEAEVVEAISFEKEGRIRTHLMLIDDAGAAWTVELDGGILHDRGSHRTDEMYLNPGAKGTFYLQELGGGLWKPAFGAQSFEAAERAEAKWMGLSRTNLSLSTDWSAGNADQFLTITGSGFGAAQGNGYVTFANGDDNYYDAAAAASFNYTEWTNNSITVEVPSAFSNRVRVMTASGDLLESTDSLRIGYNLGAQPGSHYGSTHMNNQSEGGHLFYVNEAIFNDPERMDAVERTLEDFVCKTGVNFRLAPEPTSLGWDLGDGQNTISFDSPSNPLSAGTVGYCNTSWWSCILGDITFYVVGQIDVVLNSNFDYDYSTGPVGPGQAKFAYVLMHELGHAMRLGHVNEWGESMYPSVTDQPSNQWCERDTISTNDRIGVSLAVERASTFTFNACGISAMEPLEVDCEPVVDVAGSVAPLNEVLPYPNPFVESLWIPGFGASHTVDVFSSSGQLVQRLSVPRDGMRWDTASLRDGLYILDCADCAAPWRVPAVKHTGW